MNRLTVGIALALALAIGLVSAAPAATNKLEGKVKGDADSKVKAKVVIEDRVAVRIQGLRFRKVDFGCQGGMTVQGKIDAPDSVPVRKNGNFEAENGDIEIEGKVKLKGRKIVGSLEAELDYDGRRCEAEGSFKAK